MFYEEKYSLLLVIFVLSITFLASEAVNVKVDPRVAFPVNGTTFEVSCEVDGSDEQKKHNIQFVDQNNVVYTNTTSRFVVQQKMKGRFETKLKVVWKEITLSDDEKGGCDVDGTVYPFRIFVLPEAGKPRMSVSPRKPINGIEGDDISFECRADTDIMDKIINMTILWKKGNSTHLHKLSENQTKLETRHEIRGRSLLLSSRLTILDVQPQNEGSYFCVADLHVETKRGNPFNSENIFRQEIQLNKVTKKENGSSDAQNMVPSQCLLSLIIILIITLQFQ